MRTELIKNYYESAEYLRLLRARADVMSKCEDPLERARMIADVWSVDPCRFIEDVLMLKLVDYQNAIKPFFLFEYQRDILWKLVDAERSGEDVELLIDKLRGMGMTWLIAAYMYWRWNFTPNWSGFILSRTETEVDDGTDNPDDSIFGKLRFFIKYTPKWLIPEGFTAKEKKGTSTDSTLRLRNPVIDSSITGSSTNANAGRSRRYSFTFIDECFFIERFTSVWRSLQSVSRVKVFVSSVKQGKVASDFKKMCEEMGHYISLNYHDHPWKDDQWYKEKEKLAEFDPEVLKEISVDYAVNIKDQYYPEIRQAACVPLVYNPHLPLYSFLDFGKQDLTVLGFAQFGGEFFDVVDAYANSQRPLAWYVPFLNPAYEVQEFSDGTGKIQIGAEVFSYNPVQMDFLRAVKARRKPVGYFGEQAHFMKVMPLNKSIAQEAMKYGIRIMYNPHAIDYETRRHATSLLLPKFRFNSDSERVLELYDALANSRYVKSNAPSSKGTTMKPAHDDEIADYRAAFENLCVNIPRIIRSQRDDVGDNIRQDGFAQGIIKYLRV